MTLSPSIVAIVKVGDKLSAMIRAPSRGRHGRTRVKDAIKF